MKKGVLTLIVSLFATILFAASEIVNGITWTYQVLGGEAQIYNEKAYHASPLSSTSGAITIPSTLGGYPVTSIGDFAFALCTKLTSVTIPSSVTFIGVHAFDGCSNLWKDENGVQYESEAKVVLINVPTSMTGGFVIPNSVRFIDSAFDGCESLTSVTIPSSVTSIGYSAFEECSSLTSVTIPSSVTSIGDEAFRRCSNLTSVTIPSSVTSIGDFVFCECDSLISVTIPSSVTSIGYSAFEYCSSLTSVDFKGKPPSVGFDAFSYISSSATGTYLSKYASEWEAVIDANANWEGLTMSCQESNKFLVEIAVNGDGSVTGVGAYEAGETVTLTATPAEGSVFCGWSTTPVSMEATYSFTMLEEAMTLTAYFAPAAALNNYVAGQGFVSANEAEQLVKDYIADNNLMSKDEAKQALLDADEVFTADEMKEMAFDTPVVEVKNDVIEIAISLQTAESLDAWQAMALQSATLEIDAQKGQVRVKVPKGDKKAAFYKFVVPNEQ